MKKMKIMISGENAAKAKEKGKFLCAFCRKV